MFVSGFCYAYYGPTQKGRDAVYSVTRAVSIFVETSSIQIVEILSRTEEQSTSAGSRQAAGPGQII